MENPQSTSKLENPQSAPAVGPLPVEPARDEASPPKLELKLRSLSELVATDDIVDVDKLVATESLVAVDPGGIFDGEDETFDEMVRRHTTSWQKNPEEDKVYFLLFSRGK